LSVFKETAMKASTLYHLLALLISIVLVVAAAIAASNTATAQTPPAAPGGDTGSERRRPPPEALAACAGAKLNQACSFVAPIGNVHGNCWQPDSGHPLACRPERGGRDTTKSAGGKDANTGSGQRREPPPEALAACQGHKLSDACSFDTPRGTENGACFQPDGSHPLACRPAPGVKP
jgi:hypothetical protein